MRYLPHTPAEIEAMLAKVGAPDLDALFASIPEPLRLKEALDLPPPLDERALLEALAALQAKTDGQPFLGAGASPHHLPAVVSDLLLRGELLTAYTPYQPECSQGTLQIIFEFQTQVSALAGLPVANASMYDGAHAMAEAALLALRVRKKARRVLVSRAIHPIYRRVLETYLHHGEGQVETLPYDATGALDLEALAAALKGTDGQGDAVACVICGYPNFFGVIEAVDAVADLCAPSGAIPITVTTEALALGLLAPPGELGAKIAVGELSAFGNPMSFGGPALGFFAVEEAYLRQVPGRLCGATVDRKGRRSFVLTLSAREQHIRRARATSNICSNQGLCATAATIHLALLGRHGLRALARLNWQRARFAREALAKLGVRPRFTGPVFNEFVVSVDDAAAAKRRLRAAGLSGGLALGRFDDLGAPGPGPDARPDSLTDALLLGVTEVHTPVAIEAMAAAVAGSGDTEGTRP